MRNEKTFIMLCLAVGSTMLSLAETASISIDVIDDLSEKPVSNASVKVWFETDIGWRAWSEPTPIITAEGETDAHGRCRLSGKTNTGHLSCSAWKHGAYYKGDKSQQYVSKNLFGIWQPDNLVATIRLQRVEHPIPLFVRKVQWKDVEKGLLGHQGTNAVLSLDMFKGDWLPPYGHGETADLEIASDLKITGKERRFLREIAAEGDILFYDLMQTIRPIGVGDCISALNVKPTLGIKIRHGRDEGLGASVIRRLGMRKRMERTGNWECEYFNDEDDDRCYTFRIRSGYDEKGNLVGAYYGKVYGDFEFSGDLERGIISVRLLYYLNPTPLDRNLEWDMKTNLCPAPGNIGERRP